jgi:hypothetical protein
MISAVKVFILKNLKKTARMAHFVHCVADEIQIICQKGAKKSYYRKLTSAQGGTF